MVRLEAHFLRAIAQLRPFGVNGYQIDCFWTNVQG